jgi:hypothetical protein
MPAQVSGVGSGEIGFCGSVRTVGGTGGPRYPALAVQRAAPPRHSQDRARSNSVLGRFVAKNDFIRDRLGPRHPGIGAALAELRELLNDNDPSVRAEALVALENLAGKGAPPAELKSLAPTGNPADSSRRA